MRIWMYSYRLATAADMGTLRIDIVGDEAAVLLLFLLAQAQDQRVSDFFFFLAAHTNKLAP